MTCDFVILTFLIIAFSFQTIVARLEEALQNGSQTSFVNPGYQIVSTISPEEVAESAKKIQNEYVTVLAETQPT